jgi:hypothetical protein
MNRKAKKPFHVAPLQRLTVKPIENPAEQAALDERLKQIEEVAAGRLRIRFPDAATKRRALGFLAGRFPFKSRASGEALIPSTALETLALQGIPFSVVGRGTDELAAPVV